MRKNVLNLTQHAATADQRAQGVVDLSGDVLKKLTKAITFDDMPSVNDLRSRAELVSGIARAYFATQEAFAAAGVDQRFMDSPAHQVFVCQIVGARVMIGGAPFFDAFLRDALKRDGIYPMYAFSRRECVETPLGDGVSVKKEYVFKHLGFVGG